MEEDKKQIEDLQRKVASLEQEIATLKDFLYSSRVQIKDLEGIFKTVSAAPAEASFMDGSLVLFDDGSDKKIYVKINGSFVSVIVT